MNKLFKKNCDLYELKWPYYAEHFNFHVSSERILHTYPKNILNVY